MNTKLNVLIADDHVLIANLLKSCIVNDNQIKSVTTAQNGKQVLDILSNNFINIVLLDIDMPVIDGFQVLKMIKKNYPDIKIIMLTNNSRGDTVHKAIKLGANGYISKFAEFEEVLKAIYSVINNEAYLCKDSFQNLMHEMSDDFIVAPKHEDMHIDYLPSSPFCSFSNSTDALSSEKFKNGITSLTLREREILNYIINGKTTQQISEDLFISYRTVETHRKNILYKLGVKNTLSLIKLSYEYSLVHN